MKKLILIAGLLLVVGCSKEPNTKLLCQCLTIINNNCYGIDMSVSINESNKSFIVDFGNLTNIDFTETDISGEYLHLNEGKWVYNIDRIDLKLSKRYEANDIPRGEAEQFYDTISVYQCKIVDGI